MKFIRSTGMSEGTQALGKRLAKELKDNHVLWLVSGGSNIKPTVEIMQQLPDELTERLSVYLIDERFGEIGHSHSNASQLLEAGFSPKQAVFVPVIAEGFNLEETQARYAQAVENAFEHADVVIAQIGIGPDGHIAGILPHSPAIDATGWVTAYQSDPYTRVTLTFDALRQVTAVYVLTMGPDKLDPLTRLKTEDVSLDDQPAQLLKALPEVYIYNDQLGGNA